MGRDTQREVWMGEDVEVELHEPTPDHPRYTAFIEEFAMQSEGDTLDDAIATLFSKLLAHGESFLKAGQPLPPRAPDVNTGDECADRMNGR